MRCPLCCGSMENGTTSLVFNMSGEKRTIVVLDVPAFICEQCGEEYVPIENARRVEDIVRKSEENGLKMGFLNYSVAA
ncbi:MAG: type II toxin-antitoxin system MqsA family antitoxin [Chitinispirillaceae bacterium]|nr:type II toxin-antitoxin system MqsA family antitoxin [Chitinispirillaceae bacterium]